MYNIKGMKKNLANFITILRIIGTLCLIPLDIFSTSFYIVYFLCGLSDVLDGFVARKLNTVSRFGSILDTFSDILFYTMMVIKYWVYLHEIIPYSIWVVVHIIVALRLICYAYMNLVKKQALSRHTIFNKITGFLVFILPFTSQAGFVLYNAIGIIIVSSIGTIDEIIYIVQNYPLNSNHKLTN